MIDEVCDSVGRRLGLSGNLWALAEGVGILSAVEILTAPTPGQWLGVVNFVDRTFFAFKLLDERHLLVMSHCMPALQGFQLFVLKLLVDKSGIDPEKSLVVEKPRPFSEAIGIGLGRPVYLALRPMDVH